MPFYLILAILIGLAAALFALQNVAPVSVTFLVWRLDGSLAVVLLLTLLIGAVAALVAALPAVVRTRRHNRRLRQRVADLEHQVAAAGPGRGGADQPMKSASSSSAATGPAPR